MLINMKKEQVIQWILQFKWKYTQVLGSGQRAEKLLEHEGDSKTKLQTRKTSQKLEKRSVELEFQWKFQGHT